MVSPKLHTILIIEDNDEIRDNLSECLLLDGFTNILEATTGKEGIAMCMKYLPDLIICDISMPDGDGFEVLNAVVSTEVSREIPFIFSTAKSERQDLRNCLTLGADEVIIKPYEMDLLLKTVNDLLASGSKRQRKK